MRVFAGEFRLEARLLLSGFKALIVTSVLVRLCSLGMTACFRQFIEMSSKIIHIPNLPFLAHIHLVFLFYD